MDVFNIIKAHIIKTESIPHNDLLDNSLTNITKDLNHRLVKEISRKLIRNISLDDFMGIFLKSSEYKDSIALLILY